MIRLLRFLKKRDVLFLLIASVLIVAQVYLELKMPDFTKELTLIVTNEGRGFSTWDVWRNGLLMLACAAGSMVAAIFTGYCVASASSSFSRNIREALFKRILSFSAKEMHFFHTASLITRTTNDVAQVQNFMAMGAQMLLKAPLMAVWAIFKISAGDISWTYATIICVVVILAVVLTTVLICLPRFKKIQKLTDELNNAARENITGVRVIRAFNAEDYQGEKYEKINTEITKTNLFTAKTMGLIMPTLTLAMNGLVLAIYWIAALLMNNVQAGTSAMAERATIISNMAAFSQFALQVVMSFMMLIITFILLPRTLVSAKRINEVIDKPSSISDGQGESVPKGKGEIDFDDVYFSFYGDDRYALTNIDFKAKQGETIAIIGATGCGKSTIMNLLLRLYDVTKGVIKVDGVDVRDYKLEDLRKKIAIATQKAAIFKGTIKENIAYGASEIDEEKLEKCADIAKCDFIKDLEKGFDSPVAQGGTNLSGGQKQRISIARALYKESEILIFDDTFSALDYKTDMEVRRGIKKNLKDKTVIIVAQRIGTIRNADKIIVMDDGKIVGMGKHDELVKNCSVYKEIALSQLEKEEL